MRRERTDPAVIAAAQVARHKSKLTFSTLNQEKKVQDSWQGLTLAELRRRLTPLAGQDTASGTQACLTTKVLLLLAPAGIKKIYI